MEPSDTLSSTGTHALGTRLLGLELSHFCGVEQQSRARFDSFLAVVGLSCITDGARDQTLTSWFGVVPFGSGQFGSIGLGLAWLGLIRLGSIRFLVRLDLSRLVLSRFVPANFAAASLVSP